MVDMKVNTSRGYKKLGTKAKFVAVREALRGQVLSGQFYVGAKLPAERELAKQFDVSTITVNRAVANLVEEGLLVSRPRVGAFVSERVFDSLGIKTLYLMAPGDNVISRLFFKEGQKLAKQKNLHPVKVSITDKNHDEIANLITGGAYSIVIMPSLEVNDTISLAMSRSKGRSVIVADRLDSLGIHSIMGDDRHMIRMGVDFLRGKGHKNIGLVCCSRRNYVERERIASLMACYNSNVHDMELMKRIIDINLPDEEQPTEYAFEAVCKAMEMPGWDTTALICPGDETAMGIISACYAKGVSIPKEMSLISIGNTYIAEHLCPRLTSLDPDLQGQIELGLELILAEHANMESLTCLLHAVEPKLIERESTSRYR